MWPARGVGEELEEREWVLNLIGGSVQKSHTGWMWGSG